MKWVIIFFVAAICSVIGYSIGHQVVIFSMGVLAGSINTAIVLEG